VPNHPQYDMWNARYKAEQAIERERVIHQTQRDAQRVDWERTWKEYKSRWREGVVVGGRPPWWHVHPWLGGLLRKLRCRG